jgi:hypothetical protein
VSVRPSSKCCRSAIILIAFVLASNLEIINDSCGGVERLKMAALRPTTTRAG